MPEAVGAPATSSLLGGAEPTPAGRDASPTDLHPSTGARRHRGGHGDGTRRLLREALLKAHPGAHAGRGGGEADFWRYGADQIIARAGERDRKAAAPGICMG